MGGTLFVSVDIIVQQAPLSLKIVSFPELRDCTRVFLSVIHIEF